MRVAASILGFTWASAWALCAMAQSDGGDLKEAAPAADRPFAVLGDLPRPEIVRSLVATALLGEPTKAQSLAEELAARGGYAAAQGLLDLARHRDRAVRFAALQGIAEVALRRTDGIERVRAALLDEDADVRSAAYLALARVGDSSDVSVLLDGVASEDERTRAASGRALSMLSGLAYTGEEATHWADWWRGSQIVIPARLDAALRRLDQGEGAEAVGEARHFLARYVWFDVVRVQGAVRDWLRSFDARHRREGYRAAAECRLGELADDVRRAAREELDPDLLFVALCSARVLGIEVDGIPFPATGLDAIALLTQADGDAERDASLGDELHEVVRRRLELEEARIAATSTGGMGRSGGGAASGAAVWLDLHAKRAQARGQVATGAVVPTKRWLPTASSSIAWIAYPLLAAAIGLALWIALRRRRRDEDEEDSIESTDATPAAWDATFDAPTESPLACELESLALDPDALSAAGVRPREVGEVVERVRRRLATNSARITELSSRLLVAKARRDRLERLVKATVATSEESVEWQEAVAECATIEPELDANRDALFDVGTAALSTDSKAMLQSIRSRRARHRLPVHFLVLARSDEDWNRLEEALRSEAAAKRAKAAVTAAVANCLADARSDLAVQQARMNWNETIDAVTATWDSAVGALTQADDLIHPSDPDRGVRPRHASASTLA